MASSIGGLVLVYVADRARLGQLTGSSPGTLRKNLWLFARSVGLDTDVRRVTSRQVERWLMEPQIAASTRRGRLSNVKVFYSWLIAHGYASKNPCSGLQPARQPRQLPPRGLGPLDVALVFEACPDVRGQLMVSLMVQEGLRALEVAGLQVGDVDWRRRSMLVRGKGGHQRALWVTDETWGLLNRYMVECPAPAGPLLRSYSHPNRPLSKDYVADLVGEWMRSAGVKETGHALRHTAASDMLEHGAHVRTVQYVLGHQSLATTERYLRWLVGGLEDAMGGRTYRHPDDPGAVAPPA